jgi:hypothetical protein
MFGAVDEDVQDIHALPQTVVRGVKLVRKVRHHNARRPHHQRHHGRVAMFLEPSQGIPEKNTEERGEEMMKMRKKTNR